MHHSNLSGVYAITDPSLLPDDKLLQGVEAAFRGGVRIVQYRNKLASSVDRLRQAQNLAALAVDYQSLLIINDDPALCRRAGAGGVHLGRSDASIGEARRELGEDFILGVTCHGDIPYALESRILGADYCAFGRLFPSRTKPSAPACSLSVLSEAKSHGLRTVAIGGINTNNIDSVIESGADMAALIHGLFGQADIEASARALVRKFGKE